MKRFRTLNLALALASFAVKPATAEQLKVGMAIPSYAHGVLWIAKDTGIFQKNGIEATVFVLHGSADAMRLLIAGNVDVVLSGGDALIKANLAGAELVAFASVVNRFFHRIIAGPTISAPSDLKGRAIGLPMFGGPQDMAVQVALRRWGLGFGTDVSVRNMGTEYARLTALERGIVDAVTSDATPSVIRKLGLHVLGDVPSWGIPFPYMVAVARRDYLKKNDKAAEAFLKSLLEAMDYYRTHEKESLKILAKNMADERGSEGHPTESYHQNGPMIYSYPPYPDSKSFETVLQFLSANDPRAAKAKPEDFYTNAYLDRLLGRRAGRPK